MWHFKTSVGTLKILRLSNSRYGLYLNDELLGSYHAPDGAAEVVFNCSTGHHGWDSSGPPLMPKDLSDWQYVADDPPPKPTQGCHPVGATDNVAGARCSAGFIPSPATRYSQEVQP